LAALLTELVHVGSLYRNLLAFSLVDAFELQGGVLGRCKRPNGLHEGSFKSAIRLKVGRLELNSGIGARRSHVLIKSALLISMF